MKNCSFGGDAYGADISLDGGTIEPLNESICLAEKQGWLKSIPGCGAPSGPVFFMEE